MSCEVVKKGNNHGILLAREDGEFDAVQNTAKLLKHSGGCYLPVNVRMRLQNYSFVTRPNIGIPYHGNTLGLNCCRTTV
jgi:hypothetical protein